MEVLSSLPTKFPVGRHFAKNHIVMLLDVVSSKFGDLLNVKTTYYAAKGNQRVKTMSVNFRTLLEILLHEYVVSNIDSLFRHKASTPGWKKAVDNLDSSMAHMLTILCKGFAFDKDSLTIDEVTGRVCARIQLHLGISLDETLVHMHVCSLCQVCEASDLLVGCICRSALMTELLGKRLSRRFYALLHCEDFGTAQPEFEEEVAGHLYGEIVMLRKEVVMLRAALSSSTVRRLVEEDADADGDAIETGSTLATLFSRDGPSDMRQTINALAASLRNNLAFRNAPQTISDAFKLLQDATDLDIESVTADFEKLVNRSRMIRSLFIVEDAIDEVTKEELFADSFSTPIAVGL